MPKKLKQINISLTEEEYNMIQNIANAERRTVADVSRLILVDNAITIFLQKQAANGGILKKVSYKTSN